MKGDRILRAAYAWLPPVVQNAIISAAGLRWRHDRYGGTFDAILESLLASEWWDEEQIRSYQDECLRRAVEHAYRTVPHYSGRPESGQILGSGFRGSDDIEQIPVLTKEAVRAAGAALRSTAPLGRLRTARTSGTTSTPLVVWKTPHAERFQWATWWRHRRRFGLTVGEPYLSFGARVPSLSVSDRGPVWRTNLAFRQTYLPVSKLTPAHMDSLLNWLMGMKFAFFAGYPSGMQVVAKALLERRLKLATPPRAICCGAETLLPGVASLLGEAFSAPVTQVYGFTEGAGGFAECNLGRLHLDFELGFAELLPMDGAPVDSNIRRLVFTSLQNPAMPLLRYEVGDFATVGPSGCACGRRSMVIEAVDGRLEDYLVTPEGRCVYGINQAFKFARHIREAQVVQDTFDSVQVLIVPAPDFDGSDERRISEELRIRLGNSIRLSFRRVETLPRGPNEKVRAVVSRIPKPSGTVSRR